MSKLTTSSGAILFEGDRVTVGKGKAAWTVTGTHSVATDAISLVSDKGARKALDTAETLTITVRGDKGHAADREAAARAIAARHDEPVLTETEMDAVQALTANTVENAEESRADAIDWADALYAGADADYDGIEDGERCPVCGEFSDYCQGHGEIGDPQGYAILVAHENDTDHSACDARGCEIAAVQDEHTDTETHQDYPHVAGYLIGCLACETGPCVCANDPGSAPCVSDQCERAGEFDGADIAPGDTVHTTVFGKPFTGKVSRILEDGSLLLRYGAIVTEWTRAEDTTTPDAVSSASEPHSAPSEPVRVTAPGWHTEPRRAPTMNRARRRAAQQARKRADRARDRALDSLRATGQLNANWFQQ